MEPLEKIQALFTDPLTVISETIVRLLQYLEQDLEQLAALIVVLPHRRVDLLEILIEDGVFVGPFFKDFGRILHILNKIGHQNLLIGHGPSALAEPYWPTLC